MYIHRIATVFALALLSFPAHAEAAEGNIDEIIVTAQKRAQAASRTPLSISAFTGETLRTAGVVSVADLQNIAPGVQVGRDGFGVNLNIRGVTTTDNTSKGEQGIAFTIDGVPMGRPLQQGLAFFDLERVEVLRGPQGTLYGKSSTGGAINVITARPTDQLAAGIDLDIGNFDTRRLTATVNVPAGEKLAFRAAVNANRRDGYVTLSDDAPARSDEDSLSGRLSVLARPGEDTSILLTYTGGSVGGEGAGSVPVLNVLNNGHGKAQRVAIASPFGADIDEDFNNVTGQLDSRLDGVAVTLLAAHLEFAADDLTSSTNDARGNTLGPAAGFYNWRTYRGDVTTDYGELRLANARPGALDWVLGASYAREEIGESDHYWVVPLARPQLSASLNSADPVNTTRHLSRGLFGQATWHATDRLGLTLGARVSRDRVSRAGTFAAGPGPWKDPAGNSCVAPNDCIGTPNNGRQSAAKTTWRAGADYQVAPGQMLYGSVATGYKAGGFNDFDSKTGGIGLYEPEQLTAYEIGYKGRLLDKVQFNSGLFYYDYSRSQVTNLTSVGGSFVFFTKSVPVEIYGWENELRVSLGPQDALDGSLALQRSQYKRLMTGLFGTVDWTGQPLDRAPRTTASLGYTHVWDLAGQGDLALRLAARYSSGYLFSNFSSAVRFRQTSFTRSDATLTYHPADGASYIQAYVKNIENEVQVIGIPANYAAAVPLAANAPVTEPRMMGLRVGTAF